MFEGNVLHQGLARDDRDSPADAETLRVLGWSELSARLGAARDFRRVMAAQVRAGASSFDTTSARHLATLGEGKPGINPIALGNFKMTECMGSGVHNLGACGDRGSQ